MNFKRVFAVFRKEMRRFLTDIRMLGALFLPGVIIFVFYNILGGVIDNLASSTTVSPDYSYRIAINENGKDGKFEATLLSYFAYSEQAEPTITYYADEEIEEAKAKLQDQSMDAVVQLLFETENSSASLKEVNLFYNSSKAESENLYSVMLAIIDQTYKPYTVNTNNIGETSALQQSIMSFVLPMITISLLYSSVLSICPEAIAGEKERGTLLSVLSTPITPTEFATGKLLALSLLAVISGSFNALCTMLATPQIMGNVTMSLSFGGYALYFLSVLSLLLLFVSAATLISALAKSTKEATSYLGPGVAVFMVAALIPSLADCTALPFAFIPFLNTCACMQMISIGSFSLLYFGMSVLANLAVTVLFVFLSAKAFRSERIMVG